MCALMLRTPQQCYITSVTSSAKNTWFSRFVSVFSCNVSFVWSVSITNFIITRICFSKISLRICNLKWICVFLYRALHVRQNESVSEHLQSLWSVHISPPFAIWRFHYQCLIWRRLLYSFTRLCTAERKRLHQNLYKACDRSTSNWWLYSGAKFLTS